MWWNYKSNLVNDDDSKVKDGKDYFEPVFVQEQFSLVLQDVDINITRIEGVIY